MDKEKKAMVITRGILKSEVVLLVGTKVYGQS